MELVLDTKKLVVVILAFVLMASAIVYLALPKDSNNPYTGKTIANDGLDGMEWSDIMAEAQGQSVHLSFYPDSYNKRFFDEALIPAAKSYGINVTYGDLLGYQGAAADADAMAQGGKPTYDMYWMGVSGYMAFKNNVWWTDDWKAVVPNTIYLSDETDAQVSYALNGDTTKYVGDEIEFSGGQLMFMYNHDLEDPTLDYDRVKLKVGSGAAKTFMLDKDGLGTFDYNNTTVKYKSTALTNYLKAQTGTYDVKYGLPNNYSELFAWAEIWPGQFTYCNPQPTAANMSYYIGYSFVYGALYELTWENETTKTGWKIYTDKTIKERAAEIDVRLQQIRTANPTDAAFIAAFDAEFGYLYNYLDDLDPLVMKVEGKAWYAEVSNFIYQKMIGYRGNETIPQNGTAMLSYTVVSSQYPRLGDAGMNTGIYSMDTSIMEQYCWTINKQSQSKAAALVVANLLCDPQMQTEWYRITGEITNIDLQKYTDLLGGTGSPRYEAQYEKYFAFMDDWKDKDWAYIDPADLVKTAIDANPSKYYGQLGADWASRYTPAS